MKIQDPVSYQIRKETILHRARHLFSTKGYAESSMDDIAQACDMQKASLYHYFESKQHILREMVDLECARWAARLRDMEGGGDLRETLLRVATTLLKDVTDDICCREFFKIIHFESHKNPAILKALKESPTHNRQGFYSLFARHLEGRLPKPQIAIFILQFMGALIHYLSLSRLRGENMCPEPIEDGDFVEQLVTTFVKGIS